jgi:hypothetical protein
MQDDRRAQMRGEQNVRGPNGNLTRVMSPFEVNARQAMDMANRNANSAILTPRQRDMQKAGQIMQSAFAQGDRDYRRNQNLQNLSYQDTVQNFGFAGQKRNRERQDWGWEDEKRNWQRDMWKRTNDMMSGGGASVGGNFGVGGLR